MQNQLGNLIEDECEIKDGKMYFVRNKEHDEKKETLMFIHGFPGTHYDWRNQLLYFAEKNYNVIAMDLIGTGKSFCPKKVKYYTQQSYCENIISLIKHCKIEKPITVKKKKKNSKKKIQKKKSSLLAMIGVLLFVIIYLFIFLNIFLVWFHLLFLMDH